MSTMTDEQAMAVLDQAAGALKYAGARREGIDNLIAARAHLSSVVGERDELRDELSAAVKQGEFYFNTGHVYLVRAERAEAELALYRRTINEIDDRTEYRAFTRADISEILARLTAALAHKDSSHE